MLTAALIFLSLVSLAFSGFGPLRAIAAVAGAAAGGGLALAVKLACWRRSGPAEIALVGAPLGILFTEWTLASFRLAPYPASLRGLAVAAAATGPLLALLCAAVDHFLRAPHGPDEWSRSHVASALAAAACASAAGWALAV